MKVLVVYDSTFGKTEQIATAIGGAIAGDVKVLHAGEINPAELNLLNLFVVGSPTHFGKPLPLIQGFLKKFRSLLLRGLI